MTAPLTEQQEAEARELVRDGDHWTEWPELKVTLRHLAAREGTP